MDERRPSWTVDAYNRLWSRSEDFTAERHGLTILTCLPPSHFGQVVAVRDEYLELWDFLRDAHNGKHCGGLVLTSHTGTGASNLNPAPVPLADGNGDVVPQANIGLSSMRLLGS